MAKQVGGTIVWNLDVDKSNFSKGLASASDEAKGFGKSLASAEAGAVAFVGALTAITAAAAGVIAFGVKTAGSLEAARQGFVALLGSAELADETMARIKREAAATPFEILGLTTGTQALTAITKDGNKAIDILLDVGKAIAVSGKGQTELDRVIFNLQQISATGKVTQMDIRQFQSAIPIFNDIISAAGLTVDQLQNADNAAELLFDAFEKAGSAGGIAAEGFAAQEGTFNQLWSNLKDTVTLAADEFVRTSGIFQGVKDSLATLIDTINKFATPENIEKFVNFMVEWGPLIAGVIIGGLIAALVVLGTVAAVALAPFLPFLAIGVAVGAVVGILVMKFGDIKDALARMGEAWTSAVENIKTQLNNFWNGVKAVFTAVVDAVWAFIMDVTAPWRWLYTNVVEPILLLIQAVILRVFYEIGNFISKWSKEIFNWLNTNLFQPVLGMWNSLVTKTQEVWNSIKEKISAPITAATEKVRSVIDGVMTWIRDKWNGIVSFFSSIGTSIVNAITKPFNDAKKKIEETAEKIRKLADKINPFHKESPSLVDNVKAGLGIIRKEFDSLGTLNIQSPRFEPSLANTIASGDFEGGGAGGVTQDIDIFVDKVGSQQDIEAIGAELGFRAKYMASGVL